MIVASGQIDRMIFARGRLTPGWNYKETGISVNGQLIGSAAASSTPTSMSIKGKWLGIASPGTAGSKYIDLKDDTTETKTDHTWSGTQILND